MDKVSDFTAQAIAELEANPEVLNLRMVIEEQYDSWTGKLFPLLQSKKIPCYQFVTNLLHKAGHSVATESLVCTYMRRIREKRKPVGSSAPAVQKPLHKPVATTATVRQPVTPTPVQKPVLVVSGVEPIEVTNWITELTRLEKEKNALWNGKDQWMWNHFEGIAKRMGGSFPKDFMSVEKSMNDPIKTECMDLLLAKKH